MNVHGLLENLFKAEFKKIVSELRYHFSVEVETAEDLASDTFLSAGEYWNNRGTPDNPVAWLHTVARNKAKNFLKKKAVFDTKLSPELKRSPSSEEIGIDFFKSSIDDNQLAMIFTICDPCLSDDAQIGLALHLLCGFGIQEIADAFFTTRHVIYKRLERAKEKLKSNQLRIEKPTPTQINDRLERVLTILYLVFAEGHFSLSHSSTLREHFCTEAMRLNYLLIENESTNTPAANALFALMCFHSSRFAARTNEDGDVIPYDDQDEALWDREMICKGEYHINVAATGTTISRFHLEAGIAYWHTRKEDTFHKWESILALYDRLLELEYSPIAALNRTYALAKVKGKTQAITDAESLELTDNLFYHSLLSFLYNDRIASVH